MKLGKRSSPCAEIAVTRILKKNFEKSSLILMHYIFVMLTQLLKAEKYILLIKGDDIFLRIYVTSEITIDSCFVKAKDIDVTIVYLITESIFANDDIEKIINRDC